MKKIFLIAIFSIGYLNLTANPTISKQELNIIQESVKTHIENFTEYINTIGKPTSEENILKKKQSIRTYDIPNLFFEYIKAPRLIKYRFISGLYDQEAVRDYVTSIYDDAKQGVKWVEISLDAQSAYLSKITNPESWKLVEQRSDGTKIYETKINLNGKEISVSNSDFNKETSNNFSNIGYSSFEFKIYYITDYSNDPIILLGDIYQKLK